MFSDENNPIAESPTSGTSRRKVKKSVRQSNISKAKRKTRNSCTTKSPPSGSDTSETRGRKKGRYKSSTSKSSNITTSRRSSRVCKIFYN